MSVDEMGLHLSYIKCKYDDNEMKISNLRNLEYGKEFLMYPQEISNMLKLHDKEFIANHKIKGTSLDYDGFDGVNIYIEDIIEDENCILYKRYMEGLSNIFCLKDSRGRYNFSDYDYIIFLMAKGYGKSTFCKDNKFCLDLDIILEKEQAQGRYTLPDDLEEFDWAAYNKKIATLYSSQKITERILFSNNMTYIDAIEGKKCVIKIIGPFNPYNSDRISKDQYLLASMNYKHVQESDCTLVADFTLNPENIEDLLSGIHIERNYKKEVMRVCKLINEKKKNLDKDYYFRSYNKFVRRRLMCKRILYDDLIPFYDESFSLMSDASISFKNIFESKYYPVLQGLRTAQQYEDYLALIGSMNKRYMIDGDNWIEFCDLGVCSGNYTSYDKEKCLEKLKYWTLEYKEHCIDGSEPHFLALFSEGVNELFNNLEVIPRADDQAYTFREYLHLPKFWAVSGSTSIKRKIKVKTTNGEMKVKQTKWVNAIFDDHDEQYTRIMEKKKTADYKMIVKMGKGKTRIVVSGDLDLYAICDYIDYCVERSIKSCSISMLYLDDDQKLDFWMKFCKCDDSYFYMPLDQSDYDQMVNKKMVNIVLERFLNFFLLHAKDPVEARSIFDQVWRCFEYGFIEIEDRKELILNGVMSGYKWTAFFDTVINASELHVIRTFLEKHSLACIRDVNFQGDDVCLMLDQDVATCYYIFWLYKKLGFLIHANKFFLSNERNEYLRKVSFKGEIRGYPARNVISLLQPDLMSIESDDQRERLTVYLNGYYNFRRRMRSPISLDDKIFYPEADYYIPNASKLIHVPKSLGGFGFWPLVRSTKYRFYKKQSYLQSVEQDDNLMKGIREDPLYNTSYDGKKLFSILSPQAGRHRNNIRFGIRELDSYITLKSMNLYSDRLDTLPSDISLYSFRNNSENNSLRNSIFFDSYIRSLDISDLEKIFNFSFNINNASLSVVKAIVNNELFSAPKMFCYSESSCSIVFNRLIKYNMLFFMKDNYLTLDKLKRIAFTMELKFDKIMEKLYDCKDYS